MKNLRTVLIRPLIHWSLKAGRSSGEGTSRHIVLKKLLVDNVNDGRDQGFYVFGTADQSIYIL